MRLLIWFEPNVRRGRPEQAMTIRGMTFNDKIGGPEKSVAQMSIKFSPVRGNSEKFVIGVTIAHNVARPQYPGFLEVLKEVDTFCEMIENNEDAAADWKALRTIDTRPILVKMGFRENNEFSPGTLAKEYIDC